MNADAMLLRALKGAPISVMLALRSAGRAGTTDLMALTGYDQDAVTRSLHDLARLGFVVNTARYHGWQLTPQAVQLPLFIPAQLDGAGVEREAGKNGLEAGKNGLPLLSGGGGFNSPIVLNGLINTTTTTTREAGKNGLEAGKNGLPAKSRSGLEAPVDNPVDNFQSDPETARLAEILVARVQANRSRARAAIATASAAGAHPAEIEIEILCWLAWLTDPKTNTAGLRNPAAFIAKKIAEREAAPPARHIVTWSDDDRRIQALRCQLERRAAGGADIEEENA